MKMSEKSSVVFDVVADKEYYEELNAAEISFAMGVFNGAPVVGVAIDATKSGMGMMISPSQCELFQQDEVKQIFSGIRKTPILIGINFLDKENHDIFLEKNFYISFRCSTAFVAAMYDYHANLIQHGPIPKNIKSEFFEIENWAKFSELSLVRCMTKSGVVEKYPPAMLTPYFFDYTHFPE
jgi:hypothetical protein